VPVVPGVLLDHVTQHPAHRPLLTKKLRPNVERSGRIRHLAGILTCGTPCREGFHDRGGFDFPEGRVDIPIGSGSPDPSKRLASEHHVELILHLGHMSHKTQE
jgi:hypothetical protein